jgi:hypothetical protein
VSAEPHGASPDGDRAVAATPSSPAVSPVPASIPSVRPKRSNPDIVVAAAREIAAACVEWDNGGGSIEDWVHDIIKCRWDWGDGYKLARALEDRCHVEADLALAKALDGASYALWTAHDAAVRRWAEENDVRPTLTIGTHVATSRGDGVIGAIDEKRAIYLVVPYGEEERFRNGGGMCIDYEDASAMSARSAETAGLSPQDASAVPQADAQNQEPQL